MVISMVNLKREYALLKKEIAHTFKHLFNTQQWILGPSVEELEKAAADYLGTKYAVGVASGTDALVISLQAISIKQRGREFFRKKDEIITTPFTFIATAEAIARCGTTPVFVDIDPLTFNLNPQEVKKAINKNTIGILPVHLYGLPCAMDEIKKLSRRHNLFIVEDCAQSFGAQYKHQKTGTWGDISAFSFFPSKNLGGYGDGGLIATNDVELYNITKYLRNHGQTKPYYSEYLGYNSRLDAIQAAVLLIKLKYIEQFNRRRIDIAYQYTQALKELSFLKTPHIPENCRHIYNLYTINVPQARDNLLQFLNLCGIQARVYYPFLLPQLKTFKTAKVVGKLKNAFQAVSQVISLPIHPFLTSREINYIIRTIKKFSAN